MGERVWALGERVVVVFAMAVVAFVALAVTGTLPLPPPSPAGATQYCTQYQYNVCGPLVPPLIAFQTNRDGVTNAEVYVMNADGSTQTRLWANTNQFDGLPAWAPNRQKLAFVSMRDGNNEVYAMNVDGNGQTRLTVNPASDTLPSWSPDGQKIVFQSNRDGSTNFEVYVMNPDGSGQTRLTNNTLFDGVPAWSPDAQKIAFTSFRDGNGEIYVMNADGSSPTRLTNDPASDNIAAWSPDGEKIAFATTRDGNIEIYVMNADGSNQTRLTNNAAVDTTPSWSPDGQKIAFATTRDGSSKIYVMDADGSGVTRLTNNTASDTAPNWQRMPPGPPLNVLATAGDRRATVTFDPPVSNGGAAISSYTVTTPGGAHFTGPGSPIVVTGLTNGTTYSFDVTATNGAGTGPAVPSNAVTPRSDEPAAKITISPDATNVVGQPHTFTVSLQKNLGNGLVPAAGEHVDVTLTDASGASHTAPTGTCMGAGANTNASGQCTITFSSPTAGRVRGHATSTINVGGGPITVETDGVAPNSDDAVKTFVDANIQIAPQTATNSVGTNHVLTAHVNVNSGGGAGFVNAPNGTSIVFTIDSGPGSFTTANPCTTAGGAGSCDVTITSATTGTTVARAHVTLSVGGVAVSRNTNGTGANSGAARKTWVDTTPPVLTVPEDFAVDATSPDGAVVNYTVSATDAVDPAPVVVCVPASGTLLPMGDTTVACTAMDSAGNQSAADFVVHVRGAAEQLVMLGAAVEDAGLADNLLNKVEQALAALPDNEAATRHLKTFINSVQSQQGKKIPVDVATDLIDSATRIQAVLGP